MSNMMSLITEPIYTIVTEDCPECTPAGCRKCGGLGIPKLRKFLFGNTVDVASDNAPSILDVVDKISSSSQRGVHERH